MQIVINILEQDYERVVHGRIPVARMRNAIRNGIILPKGHGDLIDKGKFRKWIETQDGDRLMTEYYLDALEMQETIVGESRNGDID